MLDRKDVSRQINTAKTKAYVTEVNMYADLYLQIQGREPHGIVPPEEKEPLLREISKCLQDYSSRYQEPLFKYIKTPAEIYHMNKDRPGFPDLIIVPREGYSMRPHVSRGDVITQDPDHSLKGTHSLNGMFLLKGSTFKSGVNISANIIDITPTLLAALNLPVTDDMDGEIINTAFKENPHIQYEQASQIHSTDKHTFSQEEEDQIAARLADLGYL
jgi:predicted AlkP superfamily phosphohydrolase/phosphomutase